MSIDVVIDRLTPCLLEVSTGKILQTTFSTASHNDIYILPKKDWNFDWSDDKLAQSNIYKLLITGNNTIQGLISAKVVRGAVYIRLAESAPHNIGKDKMYEGVGGHLFAIAIKLSQANGFNGYVFFDAKNAELVKHYTDSFGARLLSTRFHEYRMEISETQSLKLLQKYTLEGDLNVDN